MTLGPDQTPILATHTCWTGRWTPGRCSGHKINTPTVVSAAHRKDVLALRMQPSQSDLAGRRALLGRNLLHLLHQLQVLQHGRIAETSCYGVAPACKQTAYDQNWRRMFQVDRQAVTHASGFVFCHRQHPAGLPDRSILRIVEYRWEVPLAEARGVAPEVVLGKVVPALDLARQEAAAQWRVAHDGDAQFSAHGDDVALQRTSGELVLRSSCGINQG